MLFRPYAGSGRLSKLLSRQSCRHIDGEIISRRLILFDNDFGALLPPAQLSGISSMVFIDASIKSQTLLTASGSMEPAFASMISWNLLALLRKIFRKAMRRSR
jgi:hypothetical protein